MLDPQVQTTHQDYKRTVKVSGLEKSAVDYKFDCDGKTISVAEYFKNRYKKTLKYPKLPLLNVGTKNKPNCLPMEVRGWDWVVELRKTTCKE